MSAAPPSYETATQPSLNVTDPAGHTGPARSASQDPGQTQLQRVESNASTASSDGWGGGLVDEEGRRSMDDEQRELPEGWVRCFDPKNEHHFYVDTATKRSTWLHPYDDPEYLRSLPDTHPAHPDSAQAKAVRKHAEDEQLMAEKAGAKGQAGAGGHVQGGGERNWLQRKKDKLIGTKEERAKAKEDRRKEKEERKRKIREQEQAYLKRRQELLQKQLNDPAIRRYYASDPYGYAAPSMAFSRAGGLYGSPYGYGYGGGYGRRYGYGYPYGGYGMGGMGMGGGLALGMGGGLLGGMLIGDAMSASFHLLGARAPHDSPSFLVRACFVLALLFTVVLIAQVVVWAVDGVAVVVLMGVVAAAVMAVVEVVASRCFFCPVAK